MADVILAAAYFMALPLVAIEFKSIVEIMSGAGLTFMGTIETLAVGLPDIIDGTITVFQFAISNLICALKLLSNFHKCFFYYLLDIVGQLLYLPIRITFWAFKAFLNINMYPIEKQLWDYVEIFDCFLFSYIGFHIAHYPQNVHDDCYNCCRVKTSALIRKGMKIQEDVMETAPNLLIPGINLITRGAQSFMNPFG
jgi:hypothetical protein